ncbi:hypothetical protein TWF506_006162 [Arthrobotrys conoides]|uniref:Uncharacterized protein n=1 Tax=Arthrobotrys conoides TaxID=74498 RepID=A0AAN8PK90_9PEZI
MIAFQCNAIQRIFGPGSTREDATDGSDSFAIPGEEFWMSIREYCRSKPPGEISLEIPFATDIIFHMLPMLDVDFFCDYIESQNPDDRFVNITTVLNTATRLKWLQLEITNPPFHLKNSDIESPEVLANLQKAVDKLDRLDYLSITKFFRRGSFFLVPPPPREEFRVP